MSINNILPLEVESEKINQLLPQVNNLETPSHSVELNRLLVAAVVSRRFCQLLLANPLIALANGYRGQPFKLSVTERTCVLASQATSLHECACQLAVAAADEPPALLPQLRHRDIRLTGTAAKQQAK